MRAYLSCWLTLLVAHALLVAFAGWLPEPVGPVVAASIYVPLWPFHSLGVSVFGAAESGGWAAPSLLGWAVVGSVWCFVWLGVVRLGFWVFKSRA